MPGMLTLDSLQSQVSTETVDNKTANEQSSDDDAEDTEDEPEEEEEGDDDEELKDPKETLEEGALYCFL